MQQACHQTLLCLGIVASQFLASLFAVQPWSAMITMVCPCQKHRCLSRPWTFPVPLPFLGPLQSRLHLHFPFLCPLLGRLRSFLNPLLGRLHPSAALIALSQGMASALHALLLSVCQLSPICSVSVVADSFRFPVLVMGRT